MSSSDLRALVVDDEAPARAALRHRLAAAEGVEVVGEAADPDQALEGVAELRPDVVFLDVEMPRGGGFEVVERLPEENPPLVVFVTAYDRYALEAFEARALDYVLKPVSTDRLEAALERVRDRRAADRDAEEHRRLLERIRTARAWLDPGADGGGRPADALPGPPGRLAVKRGGAYAMLDLANLDWLEAAGNYVRLHLGESSYLYRISLTELEEQLPDDRFVRVHRSAIVNLDRIDRIEPTGSGDFEIRLRSGHSVKMSRTYRDRLLG